MQTPPRQLPTLYFFVARRYAVPFVFSPPPCTCASFRFALAFCSYAQLDLLRLSTGTQSRVVTACTMLKRMLFRYQVCRSVFIVSYSNSIG